MNFRRFYGIFFLGVTLFSATATAHNTSSYKPLRWLPLREPGSGGWVTSFRISPHEGRRMILGGDMLGAALSTDGGQTWGPTFGFHSWEINDASFHPNDPNVIWLGTLMGPYKSADGGQNFLEKRGERSANGFPSPANFGYSAPVERVLFDPNNARHLIAFGGSSRGWDLPGQKPLWGAIWESNDGGDNWAKIATVGAEGNTGEADKGVNLYGMEFAASSSRTLYAVSPWAGFFVSQDGGKTWKKSLNGLPHSKVVRVQAHPKDPKTLWVSLGSSKPQGAAKALPGGIYRSTDGGLNWAPLNNGLSQASEANENLTANYQAFAVSPKNPDIMYCADGAWNGGVLYTTRDGGKNWRAAATKKSGGPEQPDLLRRMAQVETALPAGLAGTVFSIDPNNPNIAFNVGSEHIIGTTDGGQSWRDWGNDKQANGAWRGRGFSGWCSMNVRFNPWKRDQIALTGLDAARILLSDDGGKSWQRPLSEPYVWGGGQDVCFTPEGWIYVTTGQHGAFFGVARSRDSGKTWQSFYGAAHGLPEKDWGRGNNEPAGVYALPGAPQNVWASVGGKLYRSTDGGEHWMPVELGADVRWLAADSKNPQRFFASGAKDVYLTQDGGESWKPIGGPRQAGRLTVDMLGRLYIAAAEGQRGGLWRWDEKLPDAEKWTRLWDDGWAVNVAIDPFDANRVAFTTNQNPYVEDSKATGIWLSDDAGKTFRRANDNLPIQRGHAIAFDPFEQGEMIYGSFGRGFFETVWPRIQKLRPGRSYLSSADDATFARNVTVVQTAPVAPVLAAPIARSAPVAQIIPVAQIAQIADGAPTPPAEPGRDYLRNGGMTEGTVLPDGWAGRWGDVIAARDTKVWKEGPASLRVDADGASGQAFQLIEGVAGKTLRLSGFIKVQGAVKAQVAVQSFGDSVNGAWQQKKFDQVVYVQGEMNWLAFNKDVTIPEGTLRFNVQLLVEGQGRAWLDEVRLYDPNDTAPLPARKPGDVEITHLLRAFGPADFDYVYGSWKDKVQKGNGFVVVDSTEAGGGGLLLNDTNIAPQKQTYLAIRARLLPGNKSMLLTANLKGPEKTALFDLTKLNETDFVTITRPLGAGQFDKVSQIQLQGTDWSGAARPLKIQFAAVGTTTLDEKANAAVRQASDSSAGAPPKGKPNVPGWGYFTQFPQAWMQTHNGFVQRTKRGAEKKDINIVFFGDSITQGWGGEGKEVWDKNFAPLGAVNYGIGGDGTRQILWRIAHGEVDGISPKLIVVKIGTNNLYEDFNAGTDMEIADGIRTIVGILREKLPNTKILLLGLLPRQNTNFTNRTLRINSMIKTLDDGQGVRFLDMSDKFQTEIGKVKPELYVPDQLHLAKPGYELWAATMMPVLQEMLK